MFNLASPGARPFFRAMLFWLKKFVSFWLMPLPFCLALLVAGLWLTRSARRARPVRQAQGREPAERLGRALLLAGTALLLIFSSSFVSWWLVRPLEAAYPAVPEIRAGQPLPASLAGCRYVVVLGGGNGNSPGLPATSLLSTSAISRITEGVRLLRALPDAKLLVSGPADRRHDSHAVVLARAAESLGIENERIILIDLARDTEDEAQAVRKIAGEAQVALVTSAWHMPRAMALFRHTGLHPVAAPCDYRSHSDDELSWVHFLWDSGSLERSTCAIRERIGYLWIWLRGKT